MNDYDMVGLFSSGFFFPELQAPTLRPATAISSRGFPNRGSMAKSDRVVCHGWMRGDTQTLHEI